MSQTWECAYNKNETESKIENPTQSFREINIALQLV